MSIDLDYLIKADVALVDGKRYVREHLCCLDIDPGDDYDYPKCSRCGQEWANVYKFCPYCGARIVDGPTMEV